MSYLSSERVVGVPESASSREQDGPPLAEWLREATRDAHARAEQHPMQKALIRGEATRAQFAALTLEMRRVHRALASGRALLARNERTARLLAATPDLDGTFESDLKAQGVDHKALGVDLDGEGFGVAPWGRQAVAAYARWVRDRMVAKDPAALVGAHYVLVGSSNGGAYVARAVERSLALAPGRGTAWLNPFGDDVRPQWRRYQELLNELPVDAAERASAVAGATATFAVVEALCEEIWSAPPETVPNP